jgi:RNA polymerase sporulation-specific sigma factor
MRARLLAWLHIGRRSTLWYVHTGEGLPPPLDPEEEADCIARAATDKEAKDKLIVHNLRLVVYLARKFENTGVQTEDLISIGTIGLIKAVETFKPEKKIKLATYAARCIENEILMHLRRTTRLKLEVSFDEPLNVDWDGNELLLSDVLGTDPDVVSRDMEDEVERELLMNALSKLSERERDIIDRRFGLKNGEAQTQKQVADAMGISQSYISRLEKRIMKRLKREIVRMQS